MCRQKLGCSMFDQLMEMMHKITYQSVQRKKLMSESFPKKVQNKVRRVKVDFKIKETSQQQ